MTTIEQFRDCFVGEKGYEALKKLMKNGNELCVDIAKSWQERYDLELAYSKGLRKSSETFQKLAGRTKGSLVQALTTIATQTNVESEAHNLIANTLSTKICSPMRNLADTQLKARRTIEETLNGKFKIWKDKKEVDNKYRQRQFENSKDIENLYLKMDEIPKTTKNSVKEVSKMEMSLRKAEQELDKTEKKYHEATKEVELARQLCDAEMCQSCDQMQMMELDRINEMDKFIQTYTQTIQTLCETMNQVIQELNAIRITSQEDIVTEAKLNVQTTETEILLYDIYAENEHNAMSQERRLISLLHWMQMLKQGIEIQRRSKDVSGLVVPFQKVEDDSSDDDGAIHRHHEKKREGIENLQGFCKQNQKFSTTVNPGDITVHRESVRLLLCLYEASLYKFERIHNQIKKQPEPHYEYSQRFAKSYTEKGTPTTFLRIPFQPLVQNSCVTPAMSVLARATPIAMTPPVAHQATIPPPPPYSSQPRIGWNLANDSSSAFRVSSEYSLFPNQKILYTQSTSSTPPYPVLPNVMTTSTDSLRQQPLKHVRVLHNYDAQHDDELTIRPGDIIVLLERRSDQWCRGNLNGRIGLFPGNFVQDC